jgi:hypothetical protein
MRDLILFSPLVFLVLAIALSRLAYCRTNSIFFSSTVFTLFFSFGFAVGRTAVPLPTIILLPIAIHGLMNRPPCIQDSDGCYYEYDPEAGLIYGLIIPLMVQWAFWTTMFATFQFLFFTDRER